MKRNTNHPSAIIVGNNIRKWRLHKSFKQHNLADELHITRVALSNIETGKTDIHISRLCEISKALNVEIASLFEEPGPIRSALN